MSCRILRGSLGLCAAVVGALGAPLILALIFSSSARGDDADCPILSCLTGSCFDDNGCDEKKEDEPKCSYGPCCCHPRKTLLQWSYGTSFSGGPPGMDEPLDADRPGITVATTTVGRGVAQLESGYMYTLDHQSGTRHIDHDFPEMLWRIGMFADWFEWRIEYDYENIDNTIPNGGGPAIHERIRGSDDLLLGCRFCLTPQEGILPAMALTTQMSVPSGSPQLTEGLVMPGVLWSYGWEINKKVTLEMLTEIDRSRDDDRHLFVLITQAANIQFQLTKRLTAYAEWFVLSPDGETSERTQHYVDSGFFWHVTNNIQLDIEAGVGLNAAAEDFFAGSGAVVRF